MKFKELSTQDNIKPYTLLGPMDIIEGTIRSGHPLPIYSISTGGLQQTQAQHSVTP